MSTQTAPSHTRRMQPRSRWLTFAPSIIFVVAVILRFWQIGTKPGWEWDEPGYAHIGGQVANHGTIQAATEYGYQVVTFLYHPPFYFWELGGWFKIFGVGITQARALSATMSLIALILLYVLAKRVIGHKPALVLFAFLAIDPWMVYANRTSWMENSVIVLIAVAMLLFWRATQRATRGAFLMAGIGIGAVVIFKHTGAYLLLVVAIHYLITRKDLQKYLVLLGGVFVTVAAYLITMSAVYGDAYWRIMNHQWLRAIGSHSVNQAGNGTIQGLKGLIGPVFGQYRVFAATLIVMAIVGVWWLVRLVQAIKNRSLHTIQDNAFAFAWVSGGIIAFGAVSLKFPSYFEVILIAMYFYLATELTKVFRESPTYTRRRVLAAGMAIIAVLSLLGFQWRILGHHDNALKEVSAYAATSIPSDAVVLTEQPVGNMIKQPFCDIRAHAKRCGNGVAKWVITYKSRNYPGANDPNVRAILANSTEVASYKGFKEELTVYRVNNQ